MLVQFGRCVPSCVHQSFQSQAGFEPGAQWLALLEDTPSPHLVITSVNFRLQALRLLATQKVSLHLVCEGERLAWGGHLPP